MAGGERTGRKPIEERGTGVPTDPETVRKAMNEVMSAPTVEVMVMATVLGIGRNGAYREAQAGRFGAFKIGNIYRVPTAALREVLHLKGQTTTPAELTEAA